jgi:hypothetical protein
MLQERSAANRKMVRRLLPVVTAVLALNACAKDPQATSSTAAPLPQLNPLSHSFCAEASQDPATEKFRSDIAKLVSDQHICNDSDGGAPGVEAESSYDSTDNSGRFVKLSRTRSPGEFVHDQQLAQQGGFRQLAVANHPAIYTLGELTVQLGEDTLLDITTGVHGETAAKPGDTTPDNQAALEQVAIDILPSFS